MRVSTIGLAWAAIMLCGSDGSQGQASPWSHGRLKASANGRFLQFEDGTPFFWLADTAWLLFEKLDRSETQTYLEDRRQKGFTVIQVMVLHEMFQKDVYGAAALLDDDTARPRILSGEPDYWDHVDFAVDSAADKGLFLAIVPAWGSLVKAVQASGAVPALFKPVRIKGSLYVDGGMVNKWRIWECSRDGSP